jgi:large subunit ribosomal protein L30
MTASSAEAVAAVAAPAADGVGREEAVVANDTVVSKQAREGGTLKLTWVRSSIGNKYDQKATIKSLGFSRLNQTIEVADTPQARGQVFKVKHLLKVEEI